ncbi:MAG TPA: integrase [Gammaproteobacteria bacterium]|nr:integrase [Gammaproteobacteria bacterium]MCH77442.1 integrase [Gammaproteobacteria bacterium]
MEARPRKDGQTTYRYHPAGGRPINLGTDKIAAVRRVADMLGRTDDSGTIAHLWRQHVASPQWRNLAEGTRRSYTECSLPLLKVFGNVHASHIRPADVARYLRVERAESPSAANHEVALLSVLLRLAVELGLIDRNPCREVARNPTKRLRDAPEPAKLAAFLAWASKQQGQAVILSAMAEFAALTGNRRGEFLSLTWASVGDTEVRMRRSKQRGAEVWEAVSISPALADLLTRMRGFARDERLGYLFPNRQGNAYTDAGFKAMWAKLVRAAIQAGAIESPIRFHALRGYYATQHKAQRGALPDLHSDPGTTARTYDAAKVVKRGAL